MAIWLNLIFAKKWEIDHFSNILSFIDTDIFFPVWMDIEFDSLTWIDLAQTHGHRGEAGGEVGGQ